MQVGIIRIAENEVIIAVVAISKMFIHLLAPTSSS